MAGMLNKADPPQELPLSHGLQQTRMEEFNHADFVPLPHSFVFFVCSVIQQLSLAKCNALSDQVLCVSNERLWRCQARAILTVKCKPEAGNPQDPFEPDLLAQLLRMDRLILRTTEFLPLTGKCPKPKKHTFCFS